MKRNFLLLTFFKFSKKLRVSICWRSLYHVRWLQRYSSKKKKPIYSLYFRWDLKLFSKPIKVTAGYQQCGGATCNCAVYLKKGRKLVFVDFCGATNEKSPTSQLYGVQLGKNSTGLDAIKKMPPCKVIAPKDEDKESTWKKLPKFLGDFQCAILQGCNHYDQYVVSYSL